MMHELVSYKFSMIVKLYCLYACMQYINLNYIELEAKYKYKCANELEFFRRPGAAETYRKVFLCVCRRLKPFYRQIQVILKPTYFRYG